MQTDSALQATIDAIVQNGKGLLAADESGPTIAKRFKSIDVESTEENRRAWRELLLSTPGLAQYVSGVILYEETLGQCAAGGEPLPSLAARQGIVPGIKVDTGKGPLARTTSVQRILTVGGKAPGDGCGPAQAGREIRVPYEAAYYFYAAAR